MGKGLKAIKFNALEDDFPEKIFAIFCQRVFVHFTKEDTLKIIQKAYNSLENNGIFIFNAINRETKSVDNETRRNEIFQEIEKLQQEAKNISASDSESKISEINSKLETLIAEVKKLNS